jgi:glycosyltransferase involved in cell wall biosynthesis
MGQRYDIRKVSVVVPAKNEEENIGMVLDDLNTAISKSNKEFEVIVVNDHSRDKTAEIAKKKGARVIDNPGRSGKGNTLQLGFKQATGDVLVMMDADYSHRPEDLPLFLSAIEEGAGLVIGSRIWGGSDEYTRIRALGNIILTGAFGFVFHRYLSDLLNGYKAFRRDVFDNFRYSRSAYEIEVELAVNAMRAGYKIKEVPSHERARLAGQAKSRVVVDGTKFLMKIIIEGIKYRKEINNKRSKPV